MVKNDIQDFINESARCMKMVRGLETECWYLFVHHVIEVSRVRSNLQLESSVVGESLR